MSFIVSAVNKSMDKKWYYIELIGIFLVGGGVALILEHQIEWGYLDFTDIIGHEVYGLVSIIAGLIMAIVGYKKREVKE